MAENKSVKNNMNTAETINPFALNETFIDGGHKEGFKLQAGDTIAKAYIVQDELNRKGSQASIYIVAKGGSKYVVKMYDENYSPVLEVVNELKKNECDYIAALLEYGYESGRYFEVYDYYSKGTLEEKGKCSFDFLKNIVIPQLNEGLKYLHSLTGRGVVHGDLKPSNIFLSNDESKVIIGDFGICSYLDEKGRHVDVIKGTPEYAPRSFSLFGTVAKKASYDYGALGLVLLRLATGYSIFAGLDLGEIVEKWEAGIEIPSTVKGSLQKLIKGLILEDERNRFGYDDVKRWTDGSYVKSEKRSLYSLEDFSSKKKMKPLIFGIFDGEVKSVSTLRDLSHNIIKYWDHTKKLLERRVFLEFLSQFDEIHIESIKGYIDGATPDEAVFKILYAIGMPETIIYKGQDFGDIRNFVGMLGEGHLEIEEFINYGLFDFYLKINGYSPKDVAVIQRVIEEFRGFPELAVQIIRYMLGAVKELSGDDWQVADIDSFASLILEKNIDEINELLEDNEVLAWLYKTGFSKEVKTLLELGR